MNKQQAARPITPIEQDLLLRAEGINKSFSQGDNTLTILNNLDLRIDAGEIVALVGPSGSGKSTLLQILGLLDKADSGQITIENQQLGSLNESKRTKLRLSSIGFVYQFHHLLPEFNAMENVALPLIIAGEPKRLAYERAMKLLHQMGLKDRADHRPAKLSGGEQQRVAIARALVHDPQILLADEPTGNLDPETSALVFDLLLDQVRERNIAALLATHNLDLADQMDRVLELKAGKLLPL